MELEAALQGLSFVAERGWHRAMRVELVSDSRGTVDAARGCSLPTVERALAEAVRAKALEVGAGARWVRAHAGERWNERVDALAREARLAWVPAKVRRRAARRLARRGGRR